MKVTLTKNQKEIVQNLFENKYQFLYEKLINSFLSNKEIELFCEVISNEMMMNGIKDNFEPNEYGKELEKIIDIVNKKRLSEK
jgi:pentatricopeptide repeat protein